jgi:hypothetical protein
VIQRLCHRCQSVLHIEDEGTLLFCWNCGAPQVTLSEELQEQAAAQRAEASGQLPAGVTREEYIASQPPDLLVVWKSVIRIIAAVAASLSVLCLVLPLQFLAWMAPSIVMAIYCSRHRETRITTAVGARIGLVCGILCGFGITFTETAQILLLRFVFHRGPEIDATILQSLLQAKARVVAQSGQAAADPVFNPLLNIPEFRAGFFLFLLLFAIVILLILSTASGAFSGFMRSRRRPA